MEAEALTFLAYDEILFEWTIVPAYIMEKRELYHGSHFVCVGVGRDARIVS